MSTLSTSRKKINNARSNNNAINSSLFFPYDSSIKLFCRFLSFFTEKSGDKTYSSFDGRFISLASGTVFEPSVLGYGIRSDPTVPQSGIYQASGGAANEYTFSATNENRSFFGASLETTITLSWTGSFVGNATSSGLSSIVNIGTVTGTSANFDDWIGVHRNPTYPKGLVLSWQDNGARCKKEWTNVLPEYGVPLNITVTMFLDLSAGAPASENKAELYVNGVKLINPDFLTGTGLVTTSMSIGGSVPTLEVGRSDSGTLNANCITNMFGLWNKAMPEDEVKLFNQFQYKMLQGADPLSFSASLSSPGLFFNNILRRRLK